MNARHDFTEATKRKICDRVGSRCANPDCGAATRGPQSGGESSVNLGDAAHINAAAPNGPRYDPEQTEDERRSQANGIWLCGNCAKLVDRDVARFSAELLRHWKSSAELVAQSKLGKPEFITLSPLRLSMAASAVMHRLAAQFSEHDFPLRKNLGWSGVEDEERAYNELRAVGLLEGSSMSRFIFTDSGVEWAMRNHSDNL
jgi:hypothetical protein